MTNNHKEKGGEKKMEQNIVMKKYTCERCNHSWLPRSEEKPRVCPFCNSAYWDVPRRNPSNKAK